MKHLSEDDLVLHYYGELKRRAEAEAHLAGCDDCQKQLQKLSLLLNAVQAPETPQRSEAYGNQVWNQIRAHLPEPAKKTPWWLGLRPWALGTALAACVVAAFVIGRISSPRPQPLAIPIATSAPEKIRERVLLVAVGDHLDRSQMMLLELEHSPSQGSMDISAERQRAEELLSANRLYRQTAAQAGDAKLATVLDQLERLLLEVAHRPAKLDQAGLEQIRQQIESQGLVFKVRVLQSNVSQRIRSPKAPKASAPAGVTRQPRQTT